MKVTVERQVQLEYEVNRQWRSSYREGGREVLPHLAVPCNGRQNKYFKLKKNVHPENFKLLCQMKGYSISSFDFINS
jgi:hypothetical protein